MSNGKTNRYGLVFYPESLEFNTVFSLLRATHSMAMISPIHDQDVWYPDDCYTRYKDCFRRDNSGFIELFYATYSYEFLTGSDSESCILDTDIKTVTSKKAVKLSDLFIRPADPNNHALFNSLDEVMEAGFSYPFIALIGAKWHGSDGSVTELPIPGFEKKPHYHVLVKFDYSMTPENALNKLGVADYISYLEMINKEDSYIRYLCHLDDPDKALYSEKDVITIGGYNSDPLFYQGAIDQELANEDLYTLAKTIKVNGGGFSEMLESVMACDWKMRKAFRSNQSMWRSYLYKAEETKKVNS